MAKKLLALVLSLMLLVSTVSSVFTVFAAEVDDDTNVVTLLADGATQTNDAIVYEGKSDVSQSAQSAMGGDAWTYSNLTTAENVKSNLYQGTSPRTYVQDQSVFEKSFSNLGDGVLNKCTDTGAVWTDAWNHSNYINNGYPEKAYVLDGTTYTISDWTGEAHNDYIIDLGGAYDIKGLLLTGTDVNWKVGSYEIYVADTKEGLFNTTPIATYAIDESLWYNNTDNKGTAPAALSSNLIDTWKVADGVAISGNYVGVRIKQVCVGYHTGTKNNHLKTTLRLGELAVYGVATDHEHDYSVAAYNSKYHFNKCSICGDAADNKVAHTIIAGNLGDQGHGEACEVCEYTADVAAHDFATLGESAGEAGHNMVCICGATQVEAHNFTDIAYDSTSCWKACACGAKDEVTNYSDDARFAATGTAGSRSDYKSQVAIADSLLAGKQPIAVYYLNTDGAFKTRTSATIGDNWVKNTNGQDAWSTKNLTLADDVKEFGLGGAGLPFAVYENGRIVDCFNDESRRYIDLVYDLGDGYNINDIAIYGHPSEGLTLYKYRVSFASREEDLFADYSITSDVLTNFGSIIKIDCNEVSGRYFGIRVIAGMTPLAAKTNPTLAEGSTNFRISNISVFGTACAHESTVAKFDSKNHWTECEGCGLKTDMAAHNLTSGNQGDAGHGEACADCGYAADLVAHDYTVVGASQGEAGHIMACICGAETVVAHDFATEKTDEAGIWKECACGETLEKDLYGDANFTAVQGPQAIGDYATAAQTANSIILGKHPVVLVTNTAKGVNAARLNIWANGDNLVNTLLTEKDTNWNAHWQKLTAATPVGHRDLLGKDQNYATYGSVVTGLIEDEANMHADLIYNMGTGYKVSQLSFYSATSAYLSIYKYRVSFANSMEDLFTENAVATSDVLTNLGCSAIITPNVDITARYVGLRVITGIQPSAIGTAHGKDAYHLRFSNLTVLGETCAHAATTPKFDAENHWNECDACAEKLDVTAHTITTTENDAETHKEACECGYEAIVAHAFTTIGENQGEAGHKMVCACGVETVVAHDFTYEHDATQYWKECACGETGAKANYSDDAKFTPTAFDGDADAYKADVTIADSIIAGKLPVAYYFNADKEALSTPVRQESQVMADGGIKIVGQDGFDKWNPQFLTLADNVKEFGLGGWGLSYAVYENGRIVDVYADETNRYIDLVYDFGDLYDVDSIALLSHVSDGLTIYKYRISFANSEADLFTENAITSDVLTNFGSYIKIACNEEITAQYFAIRVIAGMTPNVVKTNPTLDESGTNFRLSNISVFGTPAEEEVVTNVEVETPAKANINYTVNGNVITVTSALACKVAYLDESGKFVKIAGTNSGDNTYTFTAPEGVTNVMIVVAGDLNGDGKLNAVDKGQLNSYVLGKNTNLSNFAKLAGDLNGDNRWNAVDKGQLNAAVLGKNQIKW